jgi:glycosyltransferase involved in cell wall biosynthesis
MPSVWARCPDARLRVVAGSEPERYWSGDKLDSRIVMHAFVADLRPLYAQAAVVAVPLLVSAGTNIKVMEAMACRKAVVTTPVGCTGLGLEDGRDAVIRDEWSAFAGAIADLLADPGRREAIAAAARRTVEARFGWDAIAAAAWTSYAEVQ